MTVARSAPGSISRATSARAASSSRKPLPAKLEDRVAIEPVARPQADSSSCRSRPIGQSSVPFARVPSSQVPRTARRRAWRFARSLEAALLGRRQGRRAGGDDLVERRPAARRLSPSRLAARADLRHRGPGLGLFQVGGDGLEASGDRVKPFGQRGVIAREQKETGRRPRCRGRTSGAPRCAGVRFVEDRAPDVVALDVTLERCLGGQARRVERLDLRQVRPVGGEPAVDRFAAPVAEDVVVRVQPSAVARTVARGDQALKADSTRS